MFENLGHFFKRMVKTEQQKELGSKDAAKERLHLVLMQDRANVSAVFLELMKQEIIDVIKKYIVVDEESIDVRLTNQSNNDGTNGAPSLYANIPIVNIKNDMMAEKIKDFEGVDFNKEIGISLPEYLNTLRIRDAIMLLKEGTMSITDIAFAVGFNTLRSFNRRFLEHTGKTPKQVKNEYISIEPETRFELNF